MAMIIPRDNTPTPLWNILPPLSKHPGAARGHDDNYPSQNLAAILECFIRNVMQPYPDMIVIPSVPSNKKSLWIIVQCFALGIMRWKLNSLNKIVFKDFFFSFHNLFHTLHFDILYTWDIYMYMWL